MPTAPHSSPTFFAEVAPAIKGIISRELQENGCKEDAADTFAGEYTAHLGKCLNSHAALVAIVKRATDFMEMNGGARMVLVEDARAALKLAETCPAPPHG